SPCRPSSPGAAGPTAAIAARAARARARRLRVPGPQAGRAGAQLVRAPARKRDSQGAGDRAAPRLRPLRPRDRTLPGPGVLRAGRAVTAATGAGGAVAGAAAARAPRPLVGTGRVGREAAGYTAPALAGSRSGARNDSARSTNSREPM